ncbi:DNA alkylation repair protein [Patescibacteria group bacterium]
MNELHQKLLELVKKEAIQNPTVSKLPPGYGGSREKDYPLSNPQLRVIVRDWLKKQPDLNYNQFITLLNSLYSQSKTATEKYLAGFLLEYLPKLRQQVEPPMFGKWLDFLTGWAQIDSLCQSKFSAAEMLTKWLVWESLIKGFSQSKSISKRRASLVLLTGPVRGSSEKKFVDLGLENINRLKTEKEILITKAISWLLREMIKNHQSRVMTFLAQNEASLPKIAVRETKRKLATGKK